MMLKNKVYDVLKWLVIVAIPAAVVLYNALAETWGFPYPEEIAKTGAAVCLFLGAVLGVSTVSYNAQKKKDQVPENIEE